MKQVYITGKGPTTLEVPMPTPGDNELLVAVYTSVISTGTDTMGMRRDISSFADNLKKETELLNKVKKSIKENGVKLTIDAIRAKLSP